MEINSDGLDIVKTALIAFVLSALSLWLQGNIDLNLADEGFLWYGTIRTAVGEIPVLDFQSYDPGRYYWTAAWSFLLGDSIMALRTSMAIFQAIGLTLGLLAARTVVRSWWALVLIGLLLIAWMYPWYKIIDASLAMAAVFFAVRLIERPTLLRHFSSGVFVGVAAFFGRNHGLYGFLAISLLILFIWFRLERDNLAKRHGFFWGGVVVGYSPMLFMVLFIPGFFGSYIEFVLSLFRTGHTNLPLPVPWPWRVNYSGMDWFIVLYRFIVGYWFLLMPAFYLFGAIGAILTGKDEIRTRALFIASTVVGVFYMHYAFSRADVEHLALGIAPLLLGLVSLPASFGFRDSKRCIIPLALLLFFTTTFSVVLKSPYVVRSIFWKAMAVEYDISGNKLWVSRNIARFVDSIRRVDEMVGPDEAMLLAPYIPTMYGVLDRKSPLREIYFLFPKPHEEQRGMIRDLEAANVNWVILGDIALDGRDELRFRHTHDLLWRYFIEEFELVEFRLSGGYMLLHRVVPLPGKLS